MHLYDMSVAAETTIGDFRSVDSTVSGISAICQYLARGGNILDDGSLSMCSQVFAERPQPKERRRNRKTEDKGKMQTLCQNYASGSMRPQLCCPKDWQA